MRVFITGASGFVGSAIVRSLLSRGDRIVALSRSARLAKSTNERLEWVQGDPTRPGDWQRSVDGCDAVLHLAGERVAGRWTSLRRRLILAARRPLVLVCASGIDHYPFDASNETYGESAPAGDGFLAEVCIAWEAAARAAERHDVRTVQMRLGVVLGGDSESGRRGQGALALMALPFRFYVGGRIGSGRQWVSWVHVADVVGAALRALDRESLSGPINVVAPEAIRQGDFARSLARTLQRPCWFPTPAPVLRLALGGFAESILQGRCAIPQRLLEDGYDFEFPEAMGALRASL